MSEPPPAAAPARERRLRFELLFAAGALGFGLLILPALVYWVGMRILGPYANGGLGAFYADLFRDLLSGSGRSWLLVGGPYGTLLLLRGLLLGLRGPHRPRRAARRRIEPTAG